MGRGSRWWGGGRVERRGHGRRSYVHLYVFRVDVTFVRLIVYLGKKSQSTVKVKTFLRPSPKALDFWYEWKAD